MDRDVLKNISLWLGTSIEEVEKMGGFFDDRYDSVLDCRVIGNAEGYIRRGTHKIIKHLGEKYRYPVLDAIKKVRQLKRKQLVEISQCRFVDLDRKLRKEMGIGPISWNGKKAVICLSHDIDSIRDYQSAPYIFELNKKYGLKSAFNFLTYWGYDIDRGFLVELDKNGFEVGLHGYTHDIAIGVRSKERIKRELSMALHKLDFQVFGYRAPAFAVSRCLLETLKELGMKYDSSMKTVSCYGQAAETFYPYRYPGVGIWEVPLTIQDDRVFRDLNLSNEEGLGVIKELAGRVIDVGGVMVINNHPKLITDKIYYYEELLKWIAGLDDVWVATSKEVVDFMEKREKYE